MKPEQAEETFQVENVTRRAGELFDRGVSCTSSVLQAATGDLSQELQAIMAGFSCGVGKSGCLCGAVTGAVMALGLQGRADQSGELISAFKATFGTTCCRGLSGGYLWMSDEHLANCRKITVATVGMIEEIRRTRK